MVTSVPASASAARTAARRRAMSDPAGGYVRKWLYVRRVLDGDFPPDPADFHLRYDEPTLDMVRQRAFLESLNIL